MPTIYRADRINRTSARFSSLRRWGALAALFVASARVTAPAQAQPELVPLLEYGYGGILLAPRAASGTGEPRARLLIAQSDPQTYGSVAQWRDPQSGAVIKTIALAARPVVGDAASSPVTTALAPQGDILANVGPQNVLFWQNAWSGAILQKFPHQKYPLAFSPDGTQFVSQQLADAEKTPISLVVRSVPQGRVLQTLELPHRASWIVWSPDGARLSAIAFADQKQYLRVWNATKGQLQWQAQSDAANFLRAWFLPDGRLAILDNVGSGDAKLRVRLWPANGGEPTVMGHNYSSGDPDVRWAVLNDGRLLVSVVRRTLATKPNQAATEKRVNLVWDVPQMAQPRPLKVGEADLTAAAHWQGQYYEPPRPFHAALPTPVALQGARLIPGRMVVADDSRFWEATTGRLRGDFQPIPPRASALAIAPDGKFFASAGGGGSGGAFLGVWASATRKLLWHRAVSLTLNNGGEYSEAGSSWATALAFSPDGERLLVASALDQPPLAFYQTRSGKLLWSTKRPSSGGIGFNASGAALSDDGALIAVKSSEPQDYFKSQVQIVSAADGAAQNNWKVPAPIAALSWSHDKTLIAVATATGHVVQGQGYSSFEADEALVELREPRTGRVQITLRGASSQVQALRFSPDGARLAGAGRDGNVYLWEVKSGQLLHTLAGHLAAVTDVAWNGNSQLVSVGADGAARFWDASGGRLLATALFLQTRAPEKNSVPNTSKTGFGGGSFERLPPVEWLLTTPDGFYDASPGAEKYLRWRVGAQLLPVARFKSRFYQPSRVRAALDFERS